MWRWMNEWVIELDECGMRMPPRPECVDTILTLNFLWSFSSMNITYTLCIVLGSQLPRAVMWKKRKKGKSVFRGSFEGSWKRINKKILDDEFMCYPSHSSLWRVGIMIINYCNLPHRLLFFICLNHQEKLYHNSYTQDSWKTVFFTTDI